MQLGAEAVFVGSGIFKSSEPAKRANAIVKAVTHFDKPGELLAVSKGLGTPMTGIAVGELAEQQKLAVRGW
jgi:pyridoxal 5'-phosphate synthase pdxS subunit